MNETLTENALGRIVNRFSDEDGNVDLEGFIDRMIEFYEERGHLGVYTQFFRDGGAKVINAIEDGKEGYYGNDESRKTLENDERYSKIQKSEEKFRIQNSSADELYRKSVEGNDSRGTEYIQERTGKVETRELDAIADNPSFKKICRFVGNDISHDIYKALAIEYEEDVRLDTYDFSEVITYDMLTDEKNELRSLYSDNISEYFNEDNSTNTDITGKKISESIIEATKDSIVKNEKRQLIPVYHSTDAEFDTFVPNDIGIHFGSFAQATQRAKDKGNSSPKIIKAYLNLTNPIYVDEDFFGWNANQIADMLKKKGLLDEAQSWSFMFDSETDIKERNRKLVELLMAKGYDGIVYSNNFESVNGRSYLVFSNDQIFRADNFKNNPKNKKGGGTYEHSGSVQGRSVRDSGNLGRRAGEYTPEPGEGIQRGTGRTEETAYAGRTAEQEVGGVRYNEISRDDWSAEMEQLAQESSDKYGVETVYFAGEATSEVKDKADAFYYDGVLYLQIDGEHDIRTLRDHEVTHHQEGSEAHGVFKESVKKKLGKEKYDELFRRYVDKYRKTLAKVIEKAQKESGGTLTDDELNQIARDYIDDEILANINAGTNEYAELCAEEVAAFRSAIENKTEAKEEVTTNASGKANDKPGEYKAEADAGPKFDLFPGKVFPKGSQASEEAIIWAHKASVKARARNVFTCYGVPYLVEKFDDMDMGYLIVKELSDGELNEWKEYKNYEDDELENGENKREKQNEEIQADEEDRERGGGFSRGANDDYSTDKHHGKIANARGMGELSHNQRVSGSFGSASDERSVGDRPRRASYDVRKRAEAAYADSDIRDSEGKLKLLYYVPTRKKSKATILGDWTVLFENENYAEKRADFEGIEGIYPVFANGGRLFDSRDEACVNDFEKMKRENGNVVIELSGLPNVEEALSIADYIEKYGLKYDTIVLDDGEGGIAYAVEHSVNVSSAEEITYDDEGKEIPMSKRFSDSKDVRFNLSGGNGDVNNDDGGYENGFGKEGNNGRGAGGVPTGYWSEADGNEGVYGDVYSSEETGNIQRRRSRSSEEGANDGRGISRGMELDGNSSVNIKHKEGDTSNQKNAERRYADAIARGDEVAARKALDAMAEQLDFDFHIRRTKMKVFPPFDESNLSDSH